MLKIKVSAIFVLLAVIGFAMSNSKSSTSYAKGDVLQEISKYRTWAKITKEPIAVKTNEFPLVGG